MTRRRARGNGNTRKESISRGLRSTVVVVRNFSVATVVDAGHVISSAKSVLHYQNGVGGSSPSGLTLGQNIIGSSTVGGGLFIKGVIMKVRVTIKFLNLESFPIVINIGYLSSSSYGVFTNNLQNSHATLAKKIIHLEKTGVQGDIKSVTLTFDIPKLEGNFNYGAFRANSSNWCTWASAATNSQGMFVEGYDIGIAINAVNGFACHMIGEYWIDVLQSNDNLLV